MHGGNGYVPRRLRRQLAHCRAVTLHSLYTLHMAVSGRQQTGDKTTT